jgi:hypothetical protein
VPIKNIFGCQYAIVVKFLGNPVEGIVNKVCVGKFGVEKFNKTRDLSIDIINPSSKDNRFILN